MTNRANKQRDYNPRTIPDEQVCAQSFLQETVLGLISEKGYALKDEVLDGAKSQMEYKLEFETISPFEPLSSWEKRESIRQQKYLNALQRIAEQLRQALTEIGCEYKQFEQNGRKGHQLLVASFAWRLSDLRRVRAQRRLQGPHQRGLQGWFVAAGFLYQS